MPNTVFADGTINQFRGGQQKENDKTGTKQNYLHITGIALFVVCHPVSVYFIALYFPQLLTLKERQKNLTTF